MRLASPRIWFLALLSVSLWLSAAHAQYFGRNKVQYQTFDWKVLKTDHFDLYYYESEKESAERASRIAERWYARLSQVMDHTLSSRQPLILYASHPDFEQTNAIEGDLDEGTGGVTEITKRRIVLPVGASLAETDHVIGHELVHAFQFDIQRQRSGSSILNPAATQLPLWFVEGMAEYLSIGPVDPNTAMWMRDAAQVNKLPTIAKLNDPRYFPYRYGQALWAYIAARWGEESVGKIMKAAAGRNASAETAIQSVTGVRADSLSKQWHAAIRAWNEPIAAVTDAPTRTGPVVETVQHGIGHYNVAPSLSPDGKRMVFLSERDVFSIEAFLADARTGRVLRRITRTATDPHFQSLQFIASAGAWSPDGKRFAFAAVVDGRPELAVIDIRTGRTLREVRFRDLGEAFNPTWSPDGRRIAFSAMTGGVTDLFLVDLATRHVTRLTHDAYSDLSPAWSPDGRSIAFATDRFGTDVDSLRYQPERIALLDPASGAITPLPGFAGARHVDPHWSPDGRSVYFVSDRGGIPNVYRLALADSAITQVTNVRTGVSGITPLSPAISVARDTAEMVFSAFVNNTYALYRVDSLAERDAHPPVTLPATLEPARISMAPVQPTAIATLRANPSIGLEAATHPTLTTYHPRLSLDNIAAGDIGVAAGGGAGVAVGGGTTLYWSDMLGDHSLATLLQASNLGGSFANNLAAIGQYTNRKNRWNWGVSAGQVPYLDRTILVDEVNVNGVPALRSQDARFWEIDRDADVNVAYPFSRVQRIELGAGYRNISYKTQVETQLQSELDGSTLLDSTFNTTPFPSISMGTLDAAYVYDSSVFGGTSPILGQSVRLEAQPAWGGLNFVGLLGDVRRYVPIARPLTLAARVLQYGRYGSGGEDPRLGQLFVGYPWLVRGYDAESFTTNDAASAQRFNTLLGSRVAVGNVELRLPLLGAAGWLRSPMLPPIEAAGFYDAGVAWTSSEKASFLGGDRKPVTSYGVALRLNLLGFAVGEVDYVHPNDRPDKSWYWKFNLQPGF